jgi:hypothetical protein
LIRWVLNLLAYLNLLGNDGQVLSVLFNGLIKVLVLLKSFLEHLLVLVHYANVRTAGNFDMLTLLVELHGDVVAVLI